MGAPNGEGPTVAAATPQEQTRTDSGDSKTFATLQAQAAMAGFELHALAGGAYIVSRWNLTSRELPDLRTAREFLRRVGVAV